MPQTNPFPILAKELAKLSSFSYAVITKGSAKECPSGLPFSLYRGLCAYGGAAAMVIIDAVARLFRSFGGA